MFSRRTAWDLARNRYTEALEDHKSAGRELLDLTASNPTTVGLAYRRDLLESLTHREFLSYRPVAQGQLSARHAVAAYYAEKGSPISADNLILTTSTSEAYSFVFRLLCNPADALLVPAPSYPLFEFLAELNDVRLAPYELVYDYGWQIEFGSIQAAIQRCEAEGAKCRAILVVHPNNPTGSFVKPHELAELNRICTAHDLAIIADEVFLDFALSHEKPLTVSANTNALTFTLSGLSKISALPQMKIAWIAVTGPDALQKEALARLEVIADTYLSMNTPLQLALPRLLAERHNIQPQLMRRIQTNLAVLDTVLPGQKLCQRLAVEGGWYSVLRVPTMGSDEVLAIAMLRATGVLLQPGHFYNFPGEGFLVASLITRTEDFATGITRALQFIAAR
jgi:aspartate/methionine/tyrosine aminotransferase